MQTASISLHPRQAVSPQPDRVDAQLVRSLGPRLRSAVTLRCEIGLSVTLHLLAVLALLLWHHAVPPEGRMASVELVMVPVGPSSAAPGPGPLTSAPENPPAAADPPPDMVPQPVPPPPVPTAVPPAAGVAPAQVPLPEPSAAQPPKPEPLPRSASREPARPHATGRPLHSHLQADAQLREGSGAAPAAEPLQPSDVEREALQHASSSWLAGVSTWLMAHRYYPEMARRMGRQGTVVLQFNVDPKGQVLDIKLVRSSGSETLDRAAQALVKDAHLPPFPPDMKLQKQSVTAPIHYEID